MVSGTTGFSFPPPVDAPDWGISLSFRPGTVILRCKIQQFALKCNNLGKSDLLVLILPILGQRLERKDGILNRLIRDSAHLIRPALVVLAGLGIFMAIRAAVVPKGFGKYGHYRPAALEMLRDKPISYAGQDTCVMCHDDQAQARAAGRHAHVACEACHGPLAQHANDPSSLKPTLPDTAVLCGRCHAKDAAKPTGFPQVILSEHSGGMACNSCHKPHNPKL